MIFIISSQSREAEAIAALCSQRNWRTQICKTVSEFTRLSTKAAPRVVITRHQLDNGYSDDVLSHLAATTAPYSTRTLVLAPADYAPQAESRQISLGADQVFRDPVRIEVLLELVGRYRLLPVPTSAPPTDFQFAGARVFPEEYRITCKGREVITTRKIMAFVQLLHRSAGRVTPYATVYDELYNRSFSGETSNCRMLWARVLSDFAQIHLDLRSHVTVIAKSGYLYTPPA